MKSNALVLPMLFLAASTSLRAAEPVRLHFAGPERAGFAHAPFSPHLSIPLPEGTYRVTVTLASEVAAETTVKAEARRLMLERVPTRPGEVATRSFLVNIRTAALEGGRTVKLNDRETGTATWNSALDLEFLSAVPTLQTVEVAPAGKHTTVYIAGDSTVTDQALEPWAGWGQVLPRFFKDDVTVSNHAESGRALKSFRNERRLDKILSTIGPGDYLFIQFGHNDMKEKGEGIGAMTSYKADLEAYVRAAREKGATPVIVTSMHRRRFSPEGKVENSFGEYVAAARKAAQDQNVALIDLNEMSARLYEALGVEPSKGAFVHYPANTFPAQEKALADNTHHNLYGAYELARCVVEAIRTSELQLKSSLAPDVVPFDPGKPDDVSAVKVPPSLPREIKAPEKPGKPQTPIVPEGN